MSALHKVPSLCHSLRQPNWNQTLYVHYASISKVLKNPPLTWAVKLGLRPLSATRAGVRAHSSLSVAPGALLSFTIGWGARCQRAPACTLLCVETLPGSSVHRILQARTLEWVAVSFCRASSRPRDLARVSRTAGGFSTLWAPRGAPQLPACSPSRAAVFPPCDQAPHVGAVETPHLAWPAHSLSTVSPGDQSPRLCSPTADQPSLWLCRPLQRAHPLCLLFYCLFSFVNRNTHVLIAAPSVSQGACCDLKLIRNARSPNPVRTRGRPQPPGQAPQAMTTAPPLPASPTRASDSGSTVWFAFSVTEEQSV